jgi:hypothetical protein
MTAHHFRPVRATVAVLAGCGADQPPATVTFSDICQQEPKARVAVDGYLRLPLMNMTCKSGRCLATFYAAPGGKGAWIGADVRNTAKPGSGVNAIEMPPKTYRAEDLRTHVKDGSVVGPDAKVRLIGEVRKSGNNCRIEVDLIEAPRG